MKVGDLVRCAYDKNKYRIGIILRVTHPHGYKGAKNFPADQMCAHVCWNSTPMGLYQTGPAWVRDLEVLSEAR